MIKKPSRKEKLVLQALKKKVITRQIIGTSLKIERGLRTTEIAKETGISRPYVSQLIQNLKNRGYNVDKPKKKVLEQEI